MNIGMYSTSLPEPGRKPGGVDVLVDRVARELALRGHHVRMLSYSPKPQGAAYELVRLGPVGWRTRKLARLLLAPARLNLVDMRGLDVLHLHGDDWFYLRRMVPTVRTFYGSARREARSATRLRRRVSQYAVFALEVLASRLATSSYGLIPGDDLVYRPRGALGIGVDVPPRSGERADRPTVLFVGTWDGRKRGRHLADAFARDVLPAHPHAELVMVSDHCEPRPGVRWVRTPTDAELDGLLRSAWMFCLPSSYEGLGIPYLEAMAAGTPVVATRNPGAEYLLDHGRAGAIVGLEDVGATIDRLLGDPGERERLAAAGLARASAFSWNEVCSAYVEAYEHAIASSRVTR